MFICNSLKLLIFSKIKKFEGKTIDFIENIKLKNFFQI